jgi:hypothetical protein
LLLAAAATTQFQVMTAAERTDSDEGPDASPGEGRKVEWEGRKERVTRVNGLIVWLDEIVIYRKETSLTSSNDRVRLMFFPMSHQRADGSHQCHRQRKTSYKACDQYFLQKK